MKTIPSWINSANSQWETGLLMQLSTAGPMSEMEYFERWKEERARAKGNNAVKAHFIRFLFTPEELKAAQRQSYANHSEQRRLDARRKRDKIKADPVLTKIHRAKVLKHMKERLAVDLDFRLRKKLRTRIHMALKGYDKADGTVVLLGCSLAEARQHLEAKFQPGMTWENWGRGGWHVDHIRPCASFDLTDPEQQRICFHYTNLQPMWESENCGHPKNYKFKKR